MAVHHSVQRHHYPFFVGAGFAGAFHYTNLQFSIFNLQFSIFNFHRVLVHHRSHAGVRPYVFGGFYHVDDGVDG